MSVKEQLAQELEGLDAQGLQRLARLMEVLKSRQAPGAPPCPDESELAALYRESGEEDQKMAEEGLQDLKEGLSREDAR